VGDFPIPFGRYSLVERLAVGGMAELFVATSPGEHGFTKKVVIKRLLPHLIEDDTYNAMFIDEAKLTARLVHPKIAQTFELGKVDGALFIAMEHVDGIDVLALLREYAARRRRIAPALAAWIAHEVLDALDYAHNLLDEDGSQLGIVHRDISPSNVLLSVRGDVKLVDFGIARAKDPDRAHKSKTGTLKGKYGYMSPEQVIEQQVDSRSDLFSIGVVLAELLTGRRLFAAANELDVLLMVRDAKLSRLDKYGADLDPSLQSIVRTALKKPVDERWQNAAAFRDAISEWLFENRHRMTPKNVADVVNELHTTVHERRTRQLSSGGDTAVLDDVVVERPPDPPPAQGRSPTDEPSITIEAGDPAPVISMSYEPADSGAHQRPSSASELAPPQAVPSLTDPPAAVPRVEITQARPPRAVIPPQTVPSPTPLASPVAPGSINTRTTPLGGVASIPPLTAPAPAIARTATPISGVRPDAPVGVEPPRRPTPPPPPRPSPLPPGLRASPTPARDLYAVHEDERVTGQHRPLGRPPTDGVVEAPIADTISAAVEAITSGTSAEDAAILHYPAEPGAPELPRQAPTLPERPQSLPTGSSDRTEDSVARSFDALTEAPRKRPQGPLPSPDELARSRPPTPPGLADIPEPPDDAGDFSNTSPLRVLFRLMTARATGLLVVAVGGIKKEIYVRDGQPEYVSSNVASELFGNYLIAKGVLSDGELAMALAMMPHYGGKLGDTLVGLGLLKPLEVFRHLTRQVRSKIIDVCTWNKGGFGWYAGRENPREAFPLDFNAFEILGAGAMALSDDVVDAWAAKNHELKLRAVRTRRVGPERFEVPGLVELADSLDGRRAVGELIDQHAERADRLRVGRMLSLLEACDLARPG
jgi:serine/threonine protein kinase